MLFKDVLSGAERGIKDYIAVNAGVKFGSISPYVRQAEEEFIIPLLSQAEYDALDLWYNAGNPPAADPVKEALLYKIQLPLANLAYMIALPVLQLNISDAGVHINTKGEMKTPFAHQMDRLEESFRKTGFNGLEKMLQFLEANKADYADWAGSSSYTIFKECFINTAEQFSGIFNISQSRHTFLQLKPIMKDVERTHVKPILCSTLYDAIKAEIAAGNVSALNQALLDFIYPAIAYLTVFEATAILPVEVNEFGMTVNAFHATFPNVKTKNPAEAEKLSTLARRLEMKGGRCLEQLKQYLDDNVDDYLDYKNSACYTEPEERVTEADGKIYLP